MPKRRILLIAVNLGLLVFCCLATAGSPKPPPGLTGEPVSLSAETIEYDPMAEVYQARGNVTVTQGSLTVRADEVYYHPPSGRLIADGRVLQTEGEDRLSAERIEYNFSEATGLILGGNLYFLDSGYFFTGERIEKTGPESYHIVNGSFTTCSCPGDCAGESAAPSWRISGSDIEITIGGYAYSRDGIFYVNEIPVLYLPFAIVPAKTERESGLLAPELAFSERDGLSLGANAFLTLGDHADATVYGLYKSLRGYGTGGELRYRTPGGGEGRFDGDYFKEEKLTDGGERSDFSFEHYQPFGRHLTLRADINYTGDQTYYQDYSNDLADITRQWTESTLSLTAAFERRALVAEAVFIDDLANTYTSNIQRIPRLSYYSMRFPILDLPFHFESEIILDNFLYYNKSYYPFINAFETIGQRLQLNPQLSLPLFPFDLFSFEARLGWRKYFYYLRQGEELATRGQFESGLEAYTTLFRDYEISLGPLSRVRHRLTPHLAYRYVPEVYPGDYESEPAFQVADFIDGWPPTNDGQRPYFDEQDRRPSFNLVTYSFSSSLAGLFRSPEAGDANRIYHGTKRELAELSVVGGYYIGPDSEPADWQARAESRPLANLRLAGRWRYRNYGHDRLRSSTYIIQAGYWSVGSVGIDYGEGASDTSDRRSRLEPTDEISTTYINERYKSIGADLLLTYIPRVALGCNFDYIIPENLLASSKYSLVYTSDCNCWKVTVEYYDYYEVPDRRSRDEVRVFLNLIGLGG